MVEITIRVKIVVHHYTRKKKNSKQKIRKFKFSFLHFFLDFIEISGKLMRLKISSYF